LIRRLQLFEGPPQFTEFRADIDWFIGQRRLFSELDAKSCVDCVAAPGDDDAVGYRTGIDFISFRHRNLRRLRRNPIPFSALPGKLISAQGL
jgi:hypothetical protein